MGGYCRSTPKAEYFLIADPIQNIPLLYTIHQLTKAEASVSRMPHPRGRNTAPRLKMVNSSQKHFR